MTDVFEVEKILKKEFRDGQVKKWLKIVLRTLFSIECYFAKLKQET